MDIVERLRGWHLEPDFNRAWAALVTLLPSAALEIEQLRDRVSKLEKLLKPFLRDEALGRKLAGAVERQR